MQGRTATLWRGLQGTSQGYGTLFKISTNGNFVLLHTFTSFERGTPYAGLMEGSDGNFYGTTYGYYAAGFGTVFQLTPGGTFTNLVFFNDANGFIRPGCWFKARTIIFMARLRRGRRGRFGNDFPVKRPHVRRFQGDNADE